MVGFCGFEERVWELNGDPARDDTENDVESLQKGSIQLVTGIAYRERCCNRRWNRI